MLTQNEFRAKVYNAITSDLTLQGLIGNRLYWIQQPTDSNVFPLIVYKFVDTVDSYSFKSGNGLNLSSEEYTIQLDIYTSSSDVTSMDNICDALQNVLVGECMRRINSNVEFPADGLQHKVVRPQRWDYINV